MEEWRVGSRLGKLNLETKLGITKRRKKACVVNSNGVRENWQVRKSEAQEVSSYWILASQGSGDPLTAMGKLLMSTLTMVETLTL